MQPSLNQSVDEQGLPSEETSDNKAGTSLGLIESETNKMVNGFDEFFSEGLPKVALPKQLDHEDILKKDNELNLVVPSPMPQESVDQGAEPGSEFNYENWLTKANEAIEEKKGKKKKKKKNRENKHQERLLVRYKKLKRGD